MCCIVNRVSSTSEVTSVSIDVSSCLRNRFSAGIEAASGWQGRRLKITNGMWTTLPFHSTSAHPLLAARSAVATNTQITPIQDEIVTAIDVRIQAMGVLIVSECDI